MTLDFLEPAGKAYQHTVIVKATSALWASTCIVCQSYITHGDEAVLFDKGPHLDRVVAAHGPCVRALAQHLMTDREMARMFAEYRQDLIEKYRVTV